jgi:2,4-dienoyl-CoA reductase (NADPH2)
MGSMHLGLETLDDDGRALAAFYAERARGGASLIVTGGWAVSPEGTAGSSYALIEDPARSGALRRVTDAVHAAGGRIALQLFHAGRYAVMGRGDVRAVAPSAIPSRFSKEPPHALTSDEVVEVIDQFGRSALRARELGFDAVEVMASEGYLVNQFCSPLTNQRNDEWGGDPARRRRFGVAVVERAHTLAGEDFPVIMRLSGADLMDGSTTRTETLAFAQALASAGAAALNVGVGWHESKVPTVQTLVPPGTWIPLAAAVKAAVGDTPVIASNRVNRLEQADEALASGACDFISMARPFLADPEIVAKAARGRSATINLCIACNQACIDRSLIDARVSCMVNPRAGHELESPFEAPSSQAVTASLADAAPSAPGPAAAAAGGGRFAVAGGGPAGLEAAHELARLGHSVVLYESTRELGGQFRLARLIPGKEDYGETIRSFATRLEALGVEVRLNTPVSDPGALAEYDGVIVATGVLPRALDLPGADLPHVWSYPDAIERANELGDRVVVIGAGGIAVDLAHRLTGGHASFLSEHPLAAEAVGASTTVVATAARNVTLLCRSKRVGGGIGITTRWAVLDALRRAEVRWHTGVTYREITPEGVVIATAEGDEQLIAADTVVIAAGQEPHDALSAALARQDIPHRVVGGALRSGGLDAVRAFAQGHRAAHELTAAATAPAA